MQGKGGMILPLCVKFCLTLPSPVYQFHKPLHQWHIRGLQSGATRALAWLTFSPHCKSWGNSHNLLPLSLAVQENLSSLPRGECGVELQRADTVVKVSPRVRRLQMTARLLSHHAHASSPQHFQPGPQKDLPSNLFSPPTFSPLTHVGLSVTASIFCTASWDLLITYVWLDHSFAQNPLTASCCPWYLMERVLTCESVWKCVCECIHTHSCKVRWFMVLKLGHYSSIGSIWCTAGYTSCSCILM